jgi:hypothetical protein
VAYTNDITRYRCQNCGKFATKIVYNRRGAVYGYFCSVHAKYALKELEKGEKEEDDRRVIREVHEL